MSSKYSLPKFQKQFEDYWVQWFETSNRYSVIDQTFKKGLDNYSNLDSSLANDLLSIFKSYLKQCNTSAEYLNQNDGTHLDFSKQNISKVYTINNLNIVINFDSKLTETLIHPALKSYENNVEDFNIKFSIYIEDDHLFLFKDEKLISKVPKLDYHILHGKFVMELICAIHYKTENDWIGTFHGSTISNSTNSVLFIGNSGSGKSTLCALLAQENLNLLSDDVSPLLLENKNIYHNPLAVSIKKGAFDILEKEIDGFKNLEEILFNRSKGTMKYLPINVSVDHYNAPCKAIVLVNYEANSKTLLEEISVKKVLETLIPDSWLNPSSNSAKAFLDWLETQELLKLTYSNNDEAKQNVLDLFNSF